MKTSETIQKLSSALLKAQKEITFAEKDGKNPHFKSNYATLESVIDAIKPPLNNNEILFTQFFSDSESGFLCLTTRLIHAPTGEYLQDTLKIPLIKNDPQSYGSAATYARRYALSAIVGLYQADDDANEACNTNNNSAKKINEQKPQLTENEFNDSLISVQESENKESITKIYTYCKSKNATHEQLKILELAAKKRINELGDKK